MSIESRRGLAALTLLLSLTAAAAAQGQVKIELRSDGQWIPLHYVCELEDIGTHQRSPITKASIGMDSRTAVVAATENRENLTGISMVELRYCIQALRVDLGRSEQRHFLTGWNRPQKQPKPRYSQHTDAPMGVPSYAS